MTFSEITVFWLVMLLCLGHGVKLPGPCPEVAPTDESLKFKHVVRILSAIPFSEENPSNLFRRAVDVFHLDINLYSPINIRYVINSDNSPFTLHWKFISKSNETVTYNATVLSPDKKLLCPDEVIEEVRLWQGTFETIGFIWSCVDGDAGGREHDEALLVIAIQDLANISEQDVKAVARLYVSEEMVDLNHIEPGFEGGSSERFYCRSKKTEMFVPGIVVPLVVLCLVGFRIYMYNREE